MGSRYDDETVQSRQRRIRELDQEMQEKLKEIQVLMKEGGLTGSARLVEEQINMSSQMDGERTSKGQNKNTNASRNVQSCITNDLNYRRNSINDGKPLNDSNSEETIYKRAVPAKRGSSSSDDYNVETSDESITAQFENLHVISPKISPKITGNIR